MLDRTIHDEVKATLTWLRQKDQGLGQLLERSCGYAVFPAMGRAGLVVGGCTGGGEVFEHGRPVGLATLSQLTVGVQVGGQIFSEVLVFQNEESLKAFKKNPITFTASASAVFIKAAATGTIDHAQVVARAYSRGGMLLELSLGGQKFHFLKHQFKFLEEGQGAGAGGDGDGKEAAKAGAEKEAAKEPAKEGGKKEKESAAKGNGSNGNGHSAGRAEAQGSAPERSERKAEEHDGDGHEGEGADDRHEHPGGLRGVFQRASAKAAHFVDAHAVHGQPLHPIGAAKGAARAASSKAAHFLSEKRAAKGGKLEQLTTGLGWLFAKDASVRQKVKWMVGGISKQSKIGPVLSEEVHAALSRITEKNPGLADAINEAYGYAVFPSVGRASIVLGGAYGRGEVFQHGHLVGYAAIAQMTIGVQLGGETFDTLILFDNAGALDRFKSGKIAFAANASAAIVTAGAAATNDYASATRVFLHSQGGLIAEAALGGQKFIFRPKMPGKG